jgi:hypothetical protein
MKLSAAETAKAIIAAMMAPNEKVEAWAGFRRQLGLKRGDFMHG